MKALKVMMVVLAVGAFSATAFGGVPPGDTCATAVAPGTPVDLAAMTFTTGDPYGSCWTGDPDLNNAWYTFEAAGDQIGLATDWTIISGYDSSFAVFNDCGGAEVGCSEDEGRYVSPWLGAICLTDLTPAAPYWVVLTSWSAGAYGTYQLDAFINKDACGNGVLDDPCEECEADEDCPEDWACNLSTCKCWNTIPTLPVWGLVGLGVLLVAGGGMVFGRRRAS